MKRSKIIIKILGLVLVLTGQGCWGIGKTVKSDVRLETVKRKSLVQRVTMAGNIEPERKMLVTAPFNGYIKKIFVKVGQKVVKNAPIVSVVQSLQSVEPVYPLRAPFSGTVVDINIQEGEFVRKDDSSEFILRIDSLSNMFVVSNVPEIDMAKVQKGQEATIKASAILDKKYKGVVEEVSMSARIREGWRSSSVEYPTKIRIVDADREIRSGMSVILDIVTSKKENVLALPHEYLFKDNDSFYVMSENGVRKKVEVGMQNEYLFEITSGVSEGEKVRQINFLELL